MVFFLFAIYWNQSSLYLQMQEWHSLELHGHLLQIHVLAFKDGSRLIAVRDYSFTRRVESSSACQMSDWVIYVEINSGFDIKGDHILLTMSPFIQAVKRGGGGKAQWMNTFYSSCKSKVSTCSTKILKAWLCATKWKKNTFAVYFRLSEETKLCGETTI